MPARKEYRFLEEYLTDITGEEEIFARFFTDEKLRVDLVARDIVGCIPILTMTDTDEIMIYKDGIYHSDGTRMLREVLIKRMGRWIKKYHVNEILAQVQALTYAGRDIMDEDKTHIWLENGIYNLETGELEEFTPYKRSTVKIPVRYDPDADCPNIDRFLHQVLPEEDVRVIYELFGYVLYRGYPLQYAFMFVGAGANGKSVLINLFKAFLGRHNCSGVSLQDIAADRFAGAELYGKLANLYPDLSADALKSTGLFKALTGGDGIQVQRKFQARFHMENYAKLIFSCNQLPRSKDITEAFIRRWIILEFPNTFRGDDADKFLINRLTTPEELSGLFNRAVKHLKEILDRGDFSKSETMDAIRRKYIRLSNSLQAFLMDCMVEDAGFAVTKEEFFNAYTKYCRAEGVPFLSKRMVGMTLPAIADVIERKISTDDGRKEAWAGLRFHIECEFSDTSANHRILREPEEPTGIGLMGWDIEEDDEPGELTQADKYKMVMDALQSAPDGLTEEAMIEALWADMDEEDIRTVLAGMRRRGNVILYGDIYRV